MVIRQRDNHVAHRFDTQILFQIFQRQGLVGVVFCRLYGTCLSIFSCFFVLCPLEFVPLDYSFTEPARLSMK